MWRQKSLQYSRGSVASPISHNSKPTPDPKRQLKTTPSRDSKQRGANRTNAKPNHNRERWDTTEHRTPTRPTHRLTLTSSHTRTYTCPINASHAERQRNCDNGGGWQVWARQSTTIGHCDEPKSMTIGCVAEGGSWERVWRV